MINIVAMHPIKNKLQKAILKAAKTRQQGKCLVKFADGEYYIDTNKYKVVEVK